MGAVRGDRVFQQDLLERIIPLKREIATCLLSVTSRKLSFYMLFSKNKQFGKFIISLQNAVAVTLVELMCVKIVSLLSSRHVDVHVYV